VDPLGKDWQKCSKNDDKSVQKMMACKNCCFNPFQRSKLFCLLLLYGRPVRLLKVPKKGMKCKDVVIPSFPETSLHVCQTGGIHWNPMGYFPTFTFLPRLDE